MPPSSHSTQDPPEVEARFRDALYMTEVMAAEICRQTHGVATLDELLSFAREGLWSAARSFDSARGVPFRCWARLRIRGAVIDGLRSSGTLPRRTYRKLRALEAADEVAETLVEEGAPKPIFTAEEADARMGTYLAGLATAMAVSLASQGGDDDPEEEAPTPEERLAHAEVAAAIRSAVSELPDVERTLVERHYYGDLTIEEAARELGMSKSWGSRLHARAIESITRALRRRGALR
jgi:RNA polymerase sigma factor for flagellar operon FliA